MEGADIIIAVEDNGAGDPGDGVGSKLVKLIAAQFDGEVIRHPSNKRCRVGVRLSRRLEADGVLGLLTRRLRCSSGRVKPALCCQQ